MLEACARVYDEQEIIVKSIPTCSVSTMCNVCVLYMICYMDKHYKDGIKLRFRKLRRSKLMQMCLLYTMYDKYSELDCQLKNKFLCYKKNVMPHILGQVK